MSWMIKRDPFSELRSFQEDFNRIFSSTLPRFFSGEEGLLGGNWAPNVDIYEDQNSITLEADLPGLKPGEFNLSIENYRLTLSGERKFEKENKGDTGAGLSAATAVSPARSACLRRLTSTR